MDDSSLELLGTHEGLYSSQCFKGVPIESDVRSIEILSIAVVLDKLCIIAVNERLVEEVNLRRDVNPDQGRLLVLEIVVGQVGHVARQL